MTKQIKKPKPIQIDNRPYNKKTTAAECIEDLQRIQKEYPTKSISRQFYLNNGKHSQATWISHFGTFKEFRRQAGLQSTRGQHELEKAVAKHVSADVYREFYDLEVKPWVGRYSKAETPGLKTMVVISDIHDQEQDPFVMSVFYDTVKRLQPDNIVFNGDIFDMSEFSRFDQDPRQFQIKERFQCVREIFKKTRKASPNSNIDLIMGNHEFRLTKWLSSKAPQIKVWLSDVMGLTFANMLGLDEFQINLVAKLDLSAWNQRDIKNEVRKNFKIYYDCFVCNHKGDEGFALSGTSGHKHRPKVETSANAFTNTFWITTGCSCRVEAEYMETLEKAQNSFLIVHIDPETKQCIPDHIMFSKDMAVVGGKFYKRK